MTTKKKTKKKIYTLVMTFRNRRKREKEGEREMGKESILCPQPHTTLLSMLRGQSADKPTTQTREREEGEEREERRGEGDEKQIWIHRRQALQRVD